MREQRLVPSLDLEVNRAGHNEEQPIRDSASVPNGMPGGLSVVVPVFNSAQSLPLLADRLRAVLNSAYPGSELILVNDGSRDNSWDVILDLSAQYRWIRGVNLMRNYGQHNALLCGVRAARHEIVVTIDDDLQNPPEEIPFLVQMLDKGYDVVYGTPEKETHGFLRNLASRMTKMALQGTMGAETARKVSAFRAFRTRIRDSFRDYTGPFVSMDVLFTWGTQRFTAIPVRNDLRAIGQSNYTVGKLITHGLNMVTGFSTLPLRLAGITGLVFGIFGFLLMGFVLARTLFNGSSVPGFPFLACAISIFSGVQLFALGIIGEYMARIHFRTMDRPSYVVRSSTNDESGDRAAEV